MPYEFAGGPYRPLCPLSKISRRWNLNSRGGAIVPSSTSVHSLGHSISMLAVMSPSTSKAPNLIAILTERCAVCGDQVKSDRLGCPACLGCILFFRRSVLKNASYKCGRKGACPVVSEFRSTCRHCRFKKCFDVGMKASAVNTCIANPSPPPYVDVPKDLLGPCVILQTRQIEEHKEQSVKHVRRASASDVNKMLMWSFNDAVEWASDYEPFQLLPNELQKCVISEFGVAFFLIDQGFKSARESKRGFWMFQNGTFLHFDYFHGLANIDDTADREKTKHHCEFVQYLEVTIKQQFQLLQIDEFELAAIKTLLLLSCSYPKPEIFAEFKGTMQKLKNKCFAELMSYLTVKLPATHAERFGKLILVMGEIRAAVKVLYNHTKVSDLFDPSKFNMFVRSFLLT
ncbi:Nuclear Hormone Receptor family [Caenorhabditis elegans]|uniref:Nuclear Hormone Receptor family n=1 Tax=Caenorhabditis elegans TaxID=6239 RepID=O17013_CAEEL|nr:Nuclear Hormone Receptor family [Caenorhabditis elegans]CCD71087.1 Nuclear Hormone Receptor family [Caenorhabditis elegans]|eukprot:NP_503328.2 Nuclear Hormone Receptor family [Caenorhabditis elegans]